MASNHALRRTPLLVGLAVATAVLAGADYFYFNSLGESAPAAPVDGPVAVVEGGAGQVCSYDASKSRVENFDDWVSFSDPSLGDPNADVVVMEFFDPNCPHCKTMHPMMKAAADSLGDRARFVFRPFVLSQGSLMQVEALHVAAQQGKFFEMLDAQYERQNPRGLSLADMESISAEIGLDYALLKRRLDSQMYRSVALRQRQLAYEAGVGVVPTVMINGRIIDSSARSVHCLAQMIDEIAS